MKKHKKYKRFCCWCGKVEYTQFCESESLDRVIDEAIAHMKRDFKQFRSKNMKTMKEEYKKFMLESNKIEGEDRLNPNDVLAVEKIRPFQDLNGRTGRIIWLKKAIDEGFDFSIPFLQMYYYQPLNHQQR